MREFSDRKAGPSVNTFDRPLRKFKMKISTSEQVVTHLTQPLLQDATDQRQSGKLSC